MPLPAIASRAEWLAARKELLAEEKALTKRRDELNTRRRELPMVEILEEYTFEGPDGTDRAGSPGGLGGAEGAGRERAGGDPRLRFLTRLAS